ncbi:MAG: hypothetical protein QNL04_08325 [SAR324 cluster bacterium]|nr:hypothetical protein [SAR324 cluster bacterium]
MSILPGILLFLFLLLLLMLYWDEYIPTNSPDQYKTPVIYRGIPDKNIDGHEYTQSEMMSSVLDTFDIPTDWGGSGDFFTIEVEDIGHKEEALRRLQLYIDSDRLYVDDQNYLVTE